MAWESVDVVVASSLLETPVSGVLVRFFNVAGTTIYTEATTNAEGRVSVLLPVGTFSMRFYRFGTQFNQPQYVEVIEGAVNTFDVTATLLTPPLANDPRLCRCSGFFRDLNGGPKMFLDMTIRAEFEPLVLEGSAVISGGLLARTNDAGWLQVDLIRGAMYRFTIESLGCERVVMVPDAPSANLPDMLFPVVDRILDIDATVNVDVGAELELVPTVVASSGVPLVGTASDDVTWKITDTNVASLSVRSDKLVITGVAAGSTTLTATRTDKSVIRIPDVAILNQPFVVEVG